MINTIIEEIKKIKSTKKELKEFGIVIGIFFGILAGISIWRGNQHYFYLLPISILLISLGFLFPNILTPIQKVWMAVAIVIGFFVSRIILSILFYFIITPLGLIIKISNPDPLDAKINRDTKSYWIKRKDYPNEKSRYLKQF